MKKAESKRTSELFLPGIAPALFLLYLYHSLLTS